MSLALSTIQTVTALATSTDDGYDFYGSAFNPAPTGGGLVAYILVAIALWQVFKKAGKPSWWAVIPFVNIYGLVKIAGYHGATILLYLIPIVNIVFALFVALRVGKAFGRGTLFSVVLLWLFAIIGYFIIGFGSSRYIGAGGDATRR